MQVQQPSSRARSRSWGSGPWTTPPPLSPRQMKPRHERSRSTTPTYYSPLASQSHQQPQGGGYDSGSVTEQEVAHPEESVRPTTAADMVESPRVSDGDAAAAAAAAKERVRLLEREAASAKQREMKMLESLVQQTKELEQAKIALEDARLELAALRQQQQHVEGGGAMAKPTTQHQQQQQQWSVMDLMFGGVDEELNGLRARLRASLQAEERSRKAGDDLAAALSAVTMEAKQVKAWLGDAQAEAEAAAAEANALRASLRAAEAELRAATERAGALAAGREDAAARWRAREKALLARARAAEEDAAAARDDSAALRQALERAAEEACAAAEALEAATGESAGLREAAAEKDRAMEALRRENEELRASEAAATARADELRQQAKEQLAAAAAPAKEPLVEKWKREDAQGGGKLGAAAFMGSGRLVPAGPRKDRMFASLSNLAELKSAAAAAAAMDSDYGYEFDHLDVAGQYAGVVDDGMKHKMKRRSILRKFGDLFRRRSHYKPDFAPVLHNHY